MPIHGSDFDVDSLFVIRRSLNSEGYPIGYEKNREKKWILQDEQKFINSFKEDLLTESEKKALLLC